MTFSRISLPSLLDLFMMRQDELYLYRARPSGVTRLYAKLQAYALDLQNPPYLIVSDMERIVVHANWTNTVSRRVELTLPELLEPAKLDILRQVFRGSDSLKPGVSPQELTAKVAGRFGELSTRLQERGEHPSAVAHFLNRLVFCMFAEDARLLPPDLFARVVRGTQTRPDLAAPSSPSCSPRCAPAASSART